MMIRTLIKAIRLLIKSYSPALLVLIIAIVISHFFVKWLLNKYRFK